MTAQICAMKKTFVVSDSSLNSFGFRMLTAGLSWGENVPMFFNHDDSLPAIGHWENFRFEGDDLLADAVFDMDDPLGASLAKKVEKGHIKAASIGASPTALSEDAADMVVGQTLPTITSALIKEVSICNIGSNRSALVLYDGKGTRINLSDAEALVKLSISINQNFDNELKEVSMKQIVKFLKLSDTATEAEVLTEIQQLKDANVALEVQLSDSKKVELKRKKDEAKGLLDVALSENRIGGDERPLFEKMFDADYDAAKGMLALRMPQVKLSQVAGNAGEPQGGGTVELKYNGKTWGELDKSGGLEGLKTANFELFKLMFKGQFGRAYTNLY